MQRVYGNNVYLSEIAQIYQPQTISSTELTEDGFLVYGANGIIGKYKDYNHETEQICITCRGNTCGMVNYTKPMSWITGNAMVINTDKYQDKVCKRYLYHYLSAYNFNSIISGSGQPQIVRTPLEKLKITLPTISLTHLILILICIYHHCISSYPRHWFCIIYHTTSISTASYTNLFRFMIVILIFANNPICPIYKKTIFC